jgi:crossover junction endodeoxyribonuclease RuvC
VLGIDPGSERTGYGCVDGDGRRPRLVRCGAVRTTAGATFPDRLSIIYRALSALIADARPDCVVIENVFHAANARSALRLGHARGVAMLAAVESGLDVFEYTPAEVKRAVVGYGRAEKPQVGQMVKLLLGLDRVPTPHDASDALAVAICHLHRAGGAGGKKGRVYCSEETPAQNTPGLLSAKSWRRYKPPARAARS